MFASLTGSPVWPSLTLSRGAELLWAKDIESGVGVLFSNAEEDDEMMEADVSAVEPLLDLSVRDGGLNDREIVRRGNGVPSWSESLLRACRVGIGNGFSTAGRAFIDFAMGGGGSTQNI
ncbi:hypothetical protein E6O75_ATG05784 [Venturia nashicola]|uniref:Uncharacterized protein n=1 Tax=Venturia nashicola TaxID=86259 RepID=A0A4Z1P3U2_9PEZI|nr:hypothetical protein E6O75_ATG05784 [Venturia nashicola]